jgi:hypothetical protein
VSFLILFAVIPIYSYNLAYYIMHMIATINYLRNLFAQIKTYAIWNWFTDNNASIEEDNYLYFSNWLYVYIAGPKKVQFLLDVLMTIISGLLLSYHGVSSLSFFASTLVPAFIMDFCVLPFVPYADLPFYSFYTLFGLEDPKDVIAIYLPG